MQQVSCPGCGAPVTFRSHASVLAVCEFCSTSVLKDADAVKDLGKMSAVLEDYSPIQIGTSGKIGGRSFDVIGRLQLRYDAGMWNEWFVIFADSSTAWLGDSSGLFTFTTACETPANLPAFNNLRVAQALQFDGKPYLVSEIRHGECIGGQGELPFKVGQGYTIDVADLRGGNQFVTLDYSDEVVKAYRGQAVTLEQLECQLLRDDDQVKESASKFKGKVGALDCPSCGSNIKYAPGISKHLICSACHAQIDAASPKAEVIAKGDAIARVRTTLSLGAKAKINGAEHQIIGLMQRQDDEGETWTEYLLYNTRGGFLWLIETNTGWARAKVQEDWPIWNGGQTARISQGEFKRLYSYPAKVSFAVGAFNWRVSVGDVVQVTEFGQGQSKLAAEMTEHELTWSLSTPLGPDQIRAWFGADIAADKAGPESEINAKNYILWLCGINAIPALFGGFGTWVLIALGVLALYLPVKYFFNKDGAA